jgi:hypothetical protein
VSGLRYSAVGTPTRSTSLGARSACWCHPFAL